MTADARAHAAVLADAARSLLDSLDGSTHPRDLEEVLGELATAQALLTRVYETLGDELHAGKPRLERDGIGALEATPAETAALRLDKAAERADILGLWVTAAHAASTEIPSPAPVAVPDEHRAAPRRLALTRVAA